MSVRKSVVAGKFYESHPQKLRSQIKYCFEHELGPGHPDHQKNYGSVKGVIVPHAGYEYSGMCAAHSYKVIKESGDYDVFVIIGFSHHGEDRRHASTLKKDWETPLGHAKVDKEFVDALLTETHIVENEISHESEHSIEVQLPFLQYLYGENFKFVPISVSSNCEFKAIADQIREVAEKTNKKICYIASSDFTHFGERFGYVPFKDNVNENIEELDNGAIEQIKVLDSAGFLDYIHQHDATICGKSAIALLLEVLKNDVNRIELLMYYKSSDVIKGDNKNHSVSYVSMVFEGISL